VQKSLERLSSGDRINRSSDDAAGLAVSAGLRSKARIYSQAVRNANDGISMLSIAQAAGENLTSIVMRLKELAQGSANGTFSRTQRIAMDSEGSALTAEYNRILGVTMFNGQQILDPNYGSLTLQIGIGTAETLRIALGASLSRNVATGALTAGPINLGGARGQISGDFNGDGKTDVVNLDLTGITVMQNNGNETFTQSFAFSNGGGGLTISAAVGDFNGDGKLDIIENYSGGIRVFTGDGAGGFSTGSSFSAAIGGTLVVGDFNGDGKTDFAASTATGVTVYNGLGTGSFATGVSSNLGGATQSITTGDYNGDGITDIIAGGSGSVTVLQGRLNSTLTTAASLSFTGSAASVLAGDLNHDGLLDIVVGNSTTAEWQILSQQSNGTLLKTSSFTLGSTIGALVDYNGDGNLDIVDGGTGFNVYRGRGDGTFQAALNLNAVESADIGLLVTDLNDDGVPDIVYSSSDPNWGTYFSNTKKTAEISRLDFSTIANARSSITTLDALLSRLGSEFGTIGAGQSRLSSIVTTLFSRSENYLAADSRIRSTDVADESANLIRQQILQQAASSVLAQANQSPALALLLLRQ